ncbi:hypothetical protein [Marinovum sp.]|uniref:hypothetical protein n=1 Tax=Marinovum sp. TaxID=2024839 RepID=UPI003A95509B
MAVLLAAAAMYFHTFSDRYDSGPLYGDVSTVFVPRVILIALGTLAAGLALRGALRPAGPAGRDLNWSRIILTFAAASAMSLGAYLLGYWIAMPLGVFLTGLAIGYPRKAVLAAVSLAATALVWFALGYLARVSLPQGQLF